MSGCSGMIAWCADLSLHDCRISWLYELCDLFGAELVEIFHILEETMRQVGETEMCMGNNVVIVPSAALL